MAMMNNMVGKRVFRNSSFAPNRGQVPPDGYIKRGLNQRATNMNPNLNQNRINPLKQGPYGGVSQWGQDGQSDTRSGIAAAALQSNLGDQSNNQQQVQSAGYAPIQGTPEIGTANALGGEVNKITPERVNSKVFVPKPYTAQVVDINQVGALSLPAQYKFDANAVAQQAKANAEILERQRADEAADLAFQKSLFDVENEYSNLSLDSLNEAAGSGAAFSSAHGKAISNNTALRHDKRSKLNTLATRSRNESISDQARIATELSAFLKQNSLDAAQSLAAEAGTLNLSSKKVKGKGKAKIRSKAKKAQAEAQVIHARTQDYLNRLHNLDANNLGQSKEQLDAAAAALQGTLRTETNNNIDAASSELNRLGLAGVGTTPISTMGTNAEQLADVEIGNDRNALNTFAAQMAAMNSRYDSLNKSSLAQSQRDIKRNEQESLDNYYSNSFRPYGGGYGGYGGVSAPRPKSSNPKVPNTKLVELIPGLRPKPSASQNGAAALVLSKLFGK